MTRGLAELRKTGGLPLGYAHLFSITGIDQLTFRAEQLAKASRTASSSKGFDNLFTNEDIGSPNFGAFDLDNANTDKR